MKYQVQFFNSNTMRVTMPGILYSTREEAMLTGQNYVRDRQREDRNCLFYRVVIGDGRHHDVSLSEFTGRS